MMIVDARNKPKNEAQSDVSVVQSTVHRYTVQKDVRSPRLPNMAFTSSMAPAVDGEVREIDLVSHRRSTRVAVL